MLRLLCLLNPIELAAVAALVFLVAVVAGVLQ